MAYPFGGNRTGGRIDVKRRIVCIKYTGERIKIFKNNFPPLLINRGGMMSKNAISCLRWMEHHRASTIYRDIECPLLLDTVNLALILNYGDSPMPKSNALSLHTTAVYTSQMLIKVLFRNEEILFGNSLANTAREFTFPFVA